MSIFGQLNLENGDNAKSDVGTDGNHYSEARGHG